MLMKNIYAITLNQLEEYFNSNSEKKFKASQVFDWLYKKRVTTFEEMTNLKKELINELKETFNIYKLEIIDKRIDEDVVKYLFRLKDNNKIEAVLMKHNYGNSLCVSTQVGCNMGCAFCESGRLKKVRNLEVDEMVLQILQIEGDLNIRISHVVLMGIGEPFDNYDNVISFIDIINSNKGIDLGSRHITISTCGIIPKIKEFINNGKQVNLAISLHAPNDELRNKIMPINKIYNLKELIQVIKEYITKTNRRVTFEYIMLKNINDSEKEALELSKLLKGINCYVNLIPYNETSHIEFKKSSMDTILKFYDILKKNNINVTIRREFGSNVKAACGQLRSLYEEE
ncbi:MAG: 23S rRNA (adenine(2503)-C(2))-methyltransferase RlmN [Bacilli bacterium]|nr:23S rRNA (adenine(2503)-C(2))-methyltransferase RlmN [Bacilli bacterium]